MFAFRCSRTGVLFPEDYVEEWGRTYGIGLGPVPVSEALINSYHAPVAEAETAAQTMHPVAVCRAQVDRVEVTEAEFEANKAILAKDDKSYSQRVEIMRNKQLLKSNKLMTMFPAEVEVARKFVDKINNTRAKALRAA